MPVKLTRSVPAGRTEAPIVYTNDGTIDYIDSDIDSNYEIDFNSELVTNSTQLDAENGVSSMVENGNGESLIEEMAASSQIEFKRVSQRILFTMFFDILEIVNQNSILALCRSCKIRKIVRDGIQSTSHFTRHLSVSI